ncbi:HTH_Tnp_Tc3_2 domain-containing protein [Trichonephila clavipes]|nr:HTH_Tnp_Tc3_2 domain-containing protein [Trichonephila clavipes]
MSFRRFRRQYEQLSQFERGRIVGMMEVGWLARRVARQFGRYDFIPTASSAQVAPSLGASVSSRIIRRCLAERHLGSRRSLRALFLTPTYRRLRLEWCHTLGLQRNGTRSYLATNPDSFSAVMTIVLVCGDPMVNASIQPLLYSDTPLPQLVCPLP